MKQEVATKSSKKMERGFQRNTVNSDDYIDYIPNKAVEHLGLLIQQGQISSC